MALPQRLSMGMPPDGAGKEFNVAHAIEIEYVNRVGELYANQELVGSISGITAVVMQHLAHSGTTGEVFVRTPFADIDQDFVVGEDLLHDGQVVAEVLEAEDLIFSQRAQIVGGNNIFNAQFVDRQGAASVRFAEGSTQFDGFGRMNVANITLIGDYQMHYGASDTVWNFQTVGTGDYEYINHHSGVMLSTGMADGDKATMTTNRNHPYQAGTGQLIFITAYSGDTGKTGVVRRWGYFDDNDGLFFQLDGDELSVVTRSNVTGSVVERIVPQHEWNYDKLDGNGTSQFSIDPSKHNLYWIDFAWLGVGAVRFGVFGEDGARLVAHVEQNGNIRQEPYMSNPRLPVRFEIENTTAQGSTSEFFGGCSAVQVEGTISKQHVPMGASDAPTVTVTGTGKTPIFGMRSATTHNGNINKVIVLPKTMSIHAFHNGTDNPARARIFIMRGVTGPTGGVWIQPPFNPDSTVEFNPAATGAITDGYGVFSTLVGGEKEVNLESIFDLLADEHLSLNSNGVAQEYWLCATPVDPTDSVDITIAVNWTEI